uniref:Uncharacterized protein n=1 Tax=Aplanochytrium stocchinoi TaxID=215587 RepID=A0A7S3LKJ1_9STRA
MTQVLLSQCVSTLQLSNHKLREACSTLCASNMRKENLAALEKKRDRDKNRDVKEENIEFVSETQIAELLKSKRKYHLNLLQRIVEIMQVHVDCLERNENHTSKGVEKGKLTLKLAGLKSQLQDKQSSLGNLKKELETLTEKITIKISENEKHEELRRAKCEEKEKLIALINSKSAEDEKLNISTVDIKSKRIKMIKEQIAQYKERAQILETAKPAEEASSEVRNELQAAHGELGAAIERKTQELNNIKNMITEREKILSKLEKILRHV